MRLTVELLSHVSAITAGTLLIACFGGAGVVFGIPAIVFGFGGAMSWITRAPERRR